MLQVFHGIAGKTSSPTIDGTQLDDNSAIDVVATATTMATDTTVIVDERSEDEQNVTVL